VRRLVEHRDARHAILRHAPQPFDVPALQRFRWISGDRDHPRVLASEERHDVIEPARQHQQYAVVRRAVPAQHGCEAARARVERRIRQLARVGVAVGQETHRQLVRALGDMQLHHRHEVGRGRHGDVGRVGRIGRPRVACGTGRRIVLSNPVRRM